MVTDMHVLVRPDSVIADVPATLAAELSSKLDSLIFAEDVQIADMTESLAQIAVIGGRASEIIGKAVSADSSALNGLPLWSQVDIESGFVVRTDDSDIPSYDVFVETSREAQAFSALESAGATPLSGELAHAIRVAAGRPAFGIDMNTDTIPLEAGLLERAISTTKGCYVGQEIVIRILHRGSGRVAKRLVKLDLASDTAGLSSAGTAVVADGKEVGALTSVAPALEGHGARALAYVHRDTAEPGRMLTLQGQPGSRATIVGFAG